MTDNDAGRQSILLFGIQFTARIVGFLGLVYFTKVIPQSRLDIYFLFFLVIQVSSLVGNLGMGQALVQRIGEGERRSELFTVGLVVITVVSLFATAIFYFFENPITNYVGASVPGLLALATGTWLVADLFIKTLQAEDRVLTSGFLQLLQDIVRVGVGAALITVGYGPKGLMYGVIAGFVATIIIAFPLSNLSVAIPARSDFRRVFSISRYTMFFGPTNFIYFWLDTFLIGVFLADGAVSSYEVAWQTTRVLIIATTAINMTIFPKVSRWANDDEFDEIERIVPGAIIFGLIFPIPGLVGLTVLGEDILRVVYQPEYVEAAIPLVILAGYMAVESVQRVGNSLLTGMDRADIPFRSRLVGVTLAIVLNLVLISRYGLIGAAVATLTSKFVDTVYQWIAIRSLLDLRIPLKSLSWQLGSAVAMGLTIAGFATVFQPTSMVRIAVVVLLGVVVYSGLVLVDPDIREVVVQYIPVPVKG
ncbi:MATE family membrane protein, Rfbx family [Halorhabdus sp. SVX81]|uniref:flippase n=1 Tax=Halorhabdus sp. SVX81 TaxID=2978283 RepID=UPI0023DC1DA3|nr:flippase [Halorhabdus sp. SVX81]WEL17232.1 MATE family membrane protein, Rfbx family [Halorhabdus sp. SVX81]